jgi:hypothetical protein
MTIETAGLKCAPAHRGQDLDQNVETTDCRKGVREQRKRNVAAGKTLGHDPRADNHRKQECRTQQLREKLALRLDHDATLPNCRGSSRLDFPMSVIWRRKQRLSRVRSGRAGTSSLRPQQQDCAFTAMPTGLPRGAEPAQQAAASASPVASLGLLSLNSGMFSSVWKCSQAIPCGSVTQCFSLRA